MYLTKLLIAYISVFFYTLSFANLPVDIIQSCKNSSAANSSIVMKELNGVGFNQTPDLNCRDQFENKINGRTYGWLTCYGKPWLIIADKRIPLESAINLSINPAIKPDTPLIQTAPWWRIDKADRSYLCIISPLSENGDAANLFQYFLVEDAFDRDKDTYTIYFYFFNKSV